jgi:hypothetical protein
LLQPDLAEEDEAIIQDIVKLEKTLYEQVCTARIVLDKLATFIKFASNLVHSYIITSYFDWLNRTEGRRATWTQLIELFKKGGTSKNGIS